MDSKPLEQRIAEAQEKLKPDNGPRNKEFTLIRGHLYRIVSRNLPYGVYDGNGGFIGIREKFGSLYLFTEDDWDNGPPYGTVTVKEDLGPIPDGIEPVGAWWVDDPETLRKVAPGMMFEGRKMYVQNRELYDFLAAAEQQHGRGTGYGGRPGDTGQEEL